MRPTSGILSHSAAALSAGWKTSSSTSFRRSPFAHSNINTPTALALSSFTPRHLTPSNSPLGNGKLVDVVDGSSKFLTICSISTAARHRTMHHRSIDGPSEAHSRFTISPRKPFGYRAKSQASSSRFRFCRARSPNSNNLAYERGSPHRHGMVGQVLAHTQPLDLPVGSPDISGCTRVCAAYGLRKGEETFRGSWGRRTEVLCGYQGCLSWSEKSGT